MINRKQVALDMGFNFGENTKILATGGSSTNKSILQVMSDVFNAPVYIQNSTEAAAIGGCYRAKYVLHQNAAQLTGEPIESYYEYIKKLCFNYRRICDPNPESGEIYIPMLIRYKEMIQVMMEHKDEIIEDLDFL
jgi:xylulokinase